MVCRVQRRQGGGPATRRFPCSSLRTPTRRRTGGLRGSEASCLASSFFQEEVPLAGRRLPFFSSSGGGVFPQNFGRILVRWVSLSDALFSRCTQEASSLTRR